MLIPNTYKPSYYSTLIVPEQPPVPYYASKRPVYVHDYSDPKALNSVVDILFNEAALNRMSLSDIRTTPGSAFSRVYGGILNWIKANDQEGFDLADVVQRIVAPFHLFMTSTYEPIAGTMMDPERRGFNKLAGFGYAGLNFLQNFSETQDILSNAVKGLILEKQGPLKGLERAFGVGPEGRYNYDFDFGEGFLNKILSMGAEIVSDPFNWMTFGAAAVGRMSARTGQDVVKEAIIRTATETGTDLSAEAVEYMAKHVLDQIRKDPTKMTKAISKTLTASAKPGLGRKAIEGLTKEFGEVFQTNIMDAVSKNLNVSLLTTAQKVSKFSQEAQGILTKASAATAGYIPAWQLLKTTSDPIASASNAKMFQNLKGGVEIEKYTPLTQYEDLFQAAEKVGKTLPVDVVDDSIITFLQVKQAQAIIFELQEIWNIMSKPGDPTGLIDEFFVQRTTATFRDYVSFLGDLAQKHPEVMYHYENLRAVEEILKARVPLQKLSDQIKETRTILRRVSPLTDSLKETTVDLVDYIKNTADFSLDAVRGTAGNLKVSTLNFFKDLQKIQQTVSSLGLEDEAIGQQIRSIQQMIREILQDSLPEEVIEELLFRSQDIALIDPVMLWGAMADMLETEGFLSSIGDMHSLLASYADNMRTALTGLENLEETTNNYLNVPLAKQPFMKHLEENVSQSAKDPDSVINRVLEAGHMKVTPTGPVKHPQYKQLFEEASEMLKVFVNGGYAPDDKDTRLFTGYLREIVEDIFTESWEDADLRVLLNLKQHLEEIQEIYNRLPDFVKEMPQRVITETGETIQVNPLVLVDSIINHIQNMIGYHAEYVSQTALTNITEYSFKASQAYAMLLIQQSSGAEGLHELIKHINEFTDHGATLNNLKAIPELTQVIGEIQSHARGHQAWINLLNQIEGDATLKHLLPNIFDSLQGYAMQDTARLFLNKEEFAEEFIDKLQSQINAIKSQRNSLEKIFDNKPEIADEFKAFLAESGITVGSHDARYDTLQVEFILKHEKLLKDFTDDLVGQGFLPVIYDLETTGTAFARDRIIQVGWRTLDGQTGDIIAGLPKGMYPSADVLRKLTQEDDIVQALQKFNSIWHVDGLVSQEEAIAQFLQALQELERQSGKNIALIGWNSSRFDDIFVKSLLERTPDAQDLQKYFFNMQKADGLVALNKLQGVPQISAEQAKNLKLHLNVYLNTKMRHPSSTIRQRFIETVDARFARNLSEVDRYLRTLSINDQTRLSLEGANVYQILSDGGSTSTIFEQHAAVFREYLQDIREHQRKLKQLKIYRDAENLNYMDWEGIDIDLPGVLNSTQFEVQDTGKVMTTAVRIEYRSDFVNRIFSGLDEANTDAFSRYQHYYFAKPATSIAQNVKNRHLAAMYYDEFAEAGSLLKEKLLEWTRKDKNLPPVYLKNLELDQVIGSYDRYGSARQLYLKVKQYANTNGYAEELKELLKIKGAEPTTLEEALALISNPRPMFDPEALKPIFDEYTNTFWNLKKQDVWVDSEAYLQELVHGPAEEVQQRLDQISRIQDRHHMGSASTQASAAVLTDAKAAWDKATAYIYAEGNDPQTVLERAELAKQYLLNHGNILAASQLQQVSELPAEDLAKYLWLASGRVTFSIPDATSREYSAFLSEVMNTFKRRAGELAEQGIEIHLDEHGKRMFIWLDNKPEIVQKWFQAEQLHYRTEIETVRNVNRQARTAAEKIQVQDWFEEVYRDIELISDLGANTPNELVDAYNMAKHSAAGNTGGRNLGTLGDMASRETMRRIDDAAPEFIRNRFIPLDVFGDIGRFDAFQFNRSNLGILSSRREITEFTSGNILKNYMNSAQSLADVMDGRTKMMHLFFDEPHSLAKGFFREMPAEDIYNTLQKHPDMRLVGLVDHPKFGAMVKEFKAKSPADITMFMQREDLHIRLMPVHTFMKAHQAINDFRIGGTFMQTLNHWVIGPLKTGYLTSIGFMVRNIVDSTLKNILMGEPDEAVQMMKHTLEVTKYYQRYKEIMQMVSAYNDGEIANTYELFSKRILDKVYENTPGLEQRMSKDLFQLFHDFVEQGPSAGLSTIQQEAIMKKTAHNKSRYGIPDEIDDLATRAMNNPVSKMVMSMNTDLEQIFRLTGYTWSIEQGLTTSEAMQNVLKHHFDYSTRSRAEAYAEYVVPFSSFTMENLKFWLDTLDRKGWMAGLYNDIYTPFWDFNNRSPEELQHNRSIQYHILDGSLIFDDSKMVLKLGPSVMDVMKLMTDPEEFLSRFIVFLRLPLESILNGTDGMELEDWMYLIATNLPLVGPLLYRQWPGVGSADKNVARLKDSNIIGKLVTKLFPTLFSAILKYDDHKYQSYPYLPRVKDMRAKQRRVYPKRTYVPRAKKSFARRAYHRKTYAPYFRQTYFKKPYPRRAWAGSFRTSTYTPQAYQRVAGQAMYTQNKVASAVRATQFRMPGHGSTVRNPRPSIYRKIYTGTGRARFQSRMVPVTSRNLAARLRSDWAYLR